MEILKELSVFNRIVFLDKTHSYLIDNKPAAKYSVTKLLESFKEPFDSEKWSKIKAREIGVSSQEMLDSWDSKSTYSKVLGTVFHSYAENYYQNKVIPYDKNWVSSQINDEQHSELKTTLESLLKQFINFYNDTKDYLIPIRNELVVGDLNHTKICGTIDLLCYNTKIEGLELYDFKTNKEINFSHKYHKRFLSPLDHLDACELNTYSLQLGLYKNFIESHTSLRIQNSFIIWLNKNNDNYRLIPLLNLSSEVQMMLEKFSQQQV
jgi:hypothetical protein